MAISSIAERAVKESKAELMSRNQQLEEKKNIKLLDFYENMQISDEYLGNWGFKGEDGKDKIPLSNVNITKQIIDRISMLYKREPERKLISKTDDKLTEDQEAIYAQWAAFNPNYDMMLKYAERYKNLLHKVLFRMHVNPEQQNWDFFVDTYYRAHFRGFDNLHPFAYSILMEPNAEYFEEGEQWWLFVSDEDMFFYEPNRQKRKTEFMMPDGTIVDYEGVNPYGVMNLVELRSEPAVTKYGVSGAIDLVNSNQAINVAVNNIHVAIQYQSFGIVWQTGEITQQRNTIKVSPFNVYVVDTGESLNSLDLNPKLLESFESINHHIKLIGNSYGVNINFSVEATAVSGVSLTIQNIDLLERREDSIDVAVNQENEIYNKLQIIQDFHKNDLSKNEPKLIKDVKVSLNFADLDFPVGLDEELKERDWNIERNIKTPLDYMDPDLDEETKMKEFEKNKRINGQMSSIDELAQELNPEGVTPNEE